MSNDKRVRINTRMVAWSDGRERHLPPSVRREVDVHSHRLSRYYRSIEDGYEAEYQGSKELAMALNYEEDADLEWERGNHLSCLNLLLLAAGSVLEVDDDYHECLDPLLNPPTQPNVALFLHLVQRCKQMCRLHPEYTPLMERSAAWSDYLYIQRVYGECGFDL